MKNPRKHLEKYDTVNRRDLPYGDKQILVIEAIAKIFSSSKKRIIKLKCTKENGLLEYPRNTVLGILKFLDTIEGIITIKASSYPYKIEVLPHFKDFYNNFRKSKIKYRITFNEMRSEILLNDKIRISKPNYDSENEAVIQYLISHPNKKITKKEIESKSAITIGKDFHKIVENLGFTGPLRKTFFKISTSTILFRNPISQADFKKLGILPLKLNKK